MNGDVVRLEFSPAFESQSPVNEFTSNPIDVSDFAKATVTCWGGVAASSAGGRVTMTLQESEDRMTWAAPNRPTLLRSCQGEFEEESLLELNRPWIRAKVTFPRPLPMPELSRPSFVAEIRLEKLRP